MTTEKAPLLPLPAAASHSQPHALLGLALVAGSAVCFSVMSTFIKLETYSMSSMEAVFWRSLTAGTLNYVRPSCLLFLDFNAWADLHSMR